MADSEVDTTQQVNTAQQVTSKTPATKPKNPKRVAAGKAIAAKTKQAREAQKKALAEAQIIIANNQIKTDPPAEPPAAPDPPAEPTKITTTRWLCHQHYRFIGGAILQTRRDQKCFYQAAACSATGAPTIACHSKKRNQNDGLFFITMVNALRASIKAAAVGGIFMAWAKITMEAFKFSWHIVLLKYETWVPILKQRVMCEKCNAYFLDDGGELIHGKLLCEYCSDGLVSDQLEK